MPSVMPDGPVMLLLIIHRVVTMPSMHKHSLRYPLHSGLVGYLCAFLLLLYGLATHVGQAHSIKNKSQKGLILHILLNMH